MKKGRKDSKRTHPVAVREVPGQSFYVESSALVAALLEHDTAVLRILSEKRDWVTSALTFAEANRAVVRAGANGRLSAAQLSAALVALRNSARHFVLIPVSEAVLARAGSPFPVEPVRTLDAIHLASIDLLDPAPQLITVVTRDIRIRQNALALGCGIA